MIIKINGVDFEVSDQAGQAINQVMAQLDSTTEKFNALKSTTTDSSVVLKLKDDHKKEVDTLQAKLDDAISKVPTAEQMDAMVESRRVVVDKASVLVEKYDHKGKSCDTIRKEIVAAKCTDVDVSKVSSDYIAARFDALTVGVENGVDKAISDSVAANAIVNKDGESKDVVMDARKQFAERNRNAWKGKNGGTK